MIATAAAFTAVCVLGAWGRTGVIATLDRPAFPAGTLLVNCLGSAAAGALHVRLDGAASTVAVVGALGALTTFSTFSTQIADDLHERRRWRALANGVATVTGCVAAATLGAALAG
ncbi:MAG: CrcB family protein [Acidobacteria bacterium]|nr:CrcB family protein [Acidobacteriota bacterium]